jgi:chromosome partitioning protein
MNKKNSGEILLIGAEKGGCGKTAMTLLLSQMLVALGFKVLMVDADPSGCLSRAVLTSVPELVLYDAIKKRCSLSDIVQKTIYGADLLPTIKDEEGNNNGDIFDNATERKTLTQIIGELNAHGPVVGSCYVAQMLRTSPLMREYDFIICDSAPSDNILTSSLTIACDSVLITAEPSLNGCGGFQMFMTSIVRSIDFRHIFKGYLKGAEYEPNLNIDGVVFTKYSRNYQTANEQCDKIRKIAAEEWQIPVYNTKIFQQATIARCIDEQLPLAQFTHYDPSYFYVMNFALEFLSKRKLAPRTMLPGIITDESGKYIYCNRFARYYTYEVADNTAKVTVHPFRRDSLADEEFMKQIGKSVFFSLDSLLEYLTYLELTIVDELPEESASAETEGGANNGT